MGKIASPSKVEHFNGSDREAIIFPVTEWTQDKHDYLSHMCNKSWKWQIEPRWPETRPQIKANLVACLLDVQICHCLLTK